MNKLLLVLLAFPMLLLFACSSSETKENETVLESSAKIQAKDTLAYLFTGHTYQWRDKEYLIDHRLMRLNLAAYDGIWLGGDISSETLLDPCILDHVNAYFDLESANTHFAMGNHDAQHTNWDWLREISGREIFYTSHYNGISLVVLATTINPANCELLDDQFDLIMNVCDTISASSHLVILQHHATWSGVPGLPEPTVYAHEDLKHWNANCESSKNNFLNSIYPRLVEVQNKGVQVLCLVGDSGAGDLRKGAEMKSDDGIYFLASGINNSGYLPDSLDFINAPDDSLLIFKHIPKERALSWDFHSLDSLVLNQ